MSQADRVLECHIDNTTQAFVVYESFIWTGAVDDWRKLVVSADHALGHEVERVLRGVPQIIVELVSTSPFHVGHVDYYTVVIGLQGDKV